jgi:hypothetical protein
MKDTFYLDDLMTGSAFPNYWIEIPCSNRRSTSGHDFNPELDVETRGAIPCLGTIFAFLRFPILCRYLLGSSRLYSAAHKHCDGIGCANRFGRCLRMAIGD